MWTCFRWWWDEIVTWRVMSARSGVQVEQQKETPTVEDLEYFRDAGQRHFSNGSRPRPMTPLASTSAAADPSAQWVYLYCRSLFTRFKYRYSEVKEYRKVSTCIKVHTAVNFDFGDCGRPWSSRGHQRIPWMVPWLSLNLLFYPAKND